MTDRVGEPVPQWVSRVTVVAVAVVAGVAAVASYVHVHTLAARAGEEWRAWLTPLSVDGLLVAASMVLLVRRREGLRAGWLPWLGLVLGLGASLGANVAAGHPEWRAPWLDGLLAAWPAVALAVAFELLILVVRDRRPAADGQSVPADVPVGSRGDQQEPDSESRDVPADDPGDVPLSPAEDERALRLIEAGVGRRKLAAELQIPEHRARALLATRRNGSGATGS